MNLTAINCTADVEDAFPDGVFTPEQLSKGAFLVDLVIVIYLFGVIAILCDEYYVPSLELLCQKLKLSQDVAGATFMAAGSSAPELFTSVIGVFVTKGDIGLGTIIGSAVFNLFCIIGLCGLFTSAVIQLNWWAVSRDCICYLISVAALVGVMQDSFVQWYEGLILLLLYTSYIILMFNNRRIEGFFRGGSSSSEREPLLHENDDNQTATSGYTSEMEYIDSDIDVEVRYTPADTNTVQEEPVSSPSPIHIPKDKSCVNVALWFLYLPCNSIFYITIPNCQKEAWSRWFPVTFVMSLVWIGFSSYIMVWMANNVGITFGIPAVVLGYTILAVGNSVPDALASVLVARNGYGDMAISNSIGSNIFDILLCLGLPWFLQATIETIANPGRDAVVSIENGGSLYTAIMLFATVFVLLILLKLTRFRLGKYLGAGFLVLYVITIATGIFIDTFLFTSRLPSC